ncbi:MAG: phosphoribosylaminoimidazolesuccinocarboxamide synthase [Acidobacteriota bacterium]|jgi:phosphoribosylaminoimidazole-succinocarboxamide synthase|nr:phosphoribosylaminoimidazolesuccinocarboxamide synthase [Acidobacteriota bacterium]
MTVLKTDLPGAVASRSGKVRDVYDYGDGMLIVASDRISAFDVIMANGIPEKGKILTQLSLMWFDLLKSVTPNHLISASVSDFPEAVQPFADILEGRTMWCKKAQVIPVEAIVRGYLAGSGWKSYQKTGEVCGHKLPPGLVQSQKLPEPIFTPTAKAESGHDWDMTREEVADQLGAELAERLESKAIEVYLKASEYAAEHGFIIADTKFEFGLVDGEMILIDEVLTPDSSRYWDIDKYEPGKPQEAYDKQYVRDYLETLAWNKEPPGPELPAEVVARTRDIYRETLRRLTS